jgi:predicted phosphoribosyltransferase
MNDEIVFQNREQAGEMLAKLLEKYRGNDAVILALPRGGVAVGKVVAQKLNLPLGIIVVRKIGHPISPEYAIAAISESGEIVTNQIDENLETKWFEEESAKELSEAKRRRQKYWGNRPQILLKGRITIIVDDGLATGLTMMAAIKEVKKEKPKKVVVAVPVASADAAQKIKILADEFIAIVVSELFFAVGAYYEDFPQISDEEVIRLLQ